MGIGRQIERGAAIRPSPPVDREILRSAKTMRRVAVASSIMEELRLMSKFILKGLNSGVKSFCLLVLMLNFMLKLGGILRVRAFSLLQNRLKH